jgi:hypothetical protein
MRKLTNEAHDIPKFIVAVRESECGHPGHLDPVLNDPKEFIVTPQRHSVGEKRRLGVHALADRSASIPGAAWRTTHIAS